MRSRAPARAGAADGDGARVQELFGRLHAMSADERRSFLMRIEDEPPGLRSELASLLEHAGSPGSFLDRSLPDELASHVDAPAERRPLLCPGDSLGDYEVLGFLARGGAGEVYRARQGSLGREVALKVLQAAAFSQAQGERFLRGAREVAAIQHPHLVELFDAGVDPARGLLFLSMRRVEGPTLQARLEELAEQGRPPDEAERREIVRRLLEVAEALGALHAHGLVHRDVKPANILIDQPGADRWSGAAVLVDYGLVRSVDGAGRLSTLWTTPAYAAPELLGRGTADGRADVFALGLCLYDLLSGRRPADRPGESPDGLPRLARIAPGIDPNLDAIVAQAVEPLPELRYRDARALAQDLASWLAGGPVVARRSSWSTRALKWIRRHPGRVLRWIGRGAALVLAACLLSIVGFEARSLLRSASEARRAWASGDLAGLARVEAALPDWLEGWSLPQDVAAAARSIRAREADPIAGVQRVLESAGSEEALLLAARFLERDGLIAHPFLARYLAAALASEATARRGAAVRLAARLCTDRPDESPEELQASEPLRAALEALLERGAGVDERSHALSALTGCGDEGTLARLLERLAALAGQGPAVNAEELRLTLRALEWNLLRSQACAFVDRALALDHARLLEQACAAVEAVPLTGTVRGSPLSAALSDLFAAVAVTERAAGVPLTATPPSERIWDPVPIHAARRSSELIAPMEAGSPGDPALAFDRAVRDGTVAGLLAEPDPIGRPGPDEPMNSREGFDHGFALGRAWLAGRRPNWRNDEDSRLGAFFELEGSALERLPFVLAGDPSGAVAGWDFLPDTPRLSGAASGLAVRCGTHEGDGNGSYVRLGVFGLSELQLGFTLDPARESIPVLHLVVQKGVRYLLPGAGEPRFEVTLDGRTAANDLPAPHLSTAEVAIPLVVSGEERRGEHVASIRLLAEANTTLRIDQAWIAEENGPYGPPGKHPDESSASSARPGR